MSHMLLPKCKVALVCLLLIKEAWHLISLRLLLQGEYQQVLCIFNYSDLFFCVQASTTVCEWTGTVLDLRV